MSETKWTSGPWEYRAPAHLAGLETPAHVVKVTVTKADRRTEFVATCNAISLPNADNAQLIAAAPDLYDALVAIDDNWGIGGFTGPEDPRAQDRFTDRTIAAWRKIRAALAKARGEA